VTSSRNNHDLLKVIPVFPGGCWLFTLLLKSMSPQVRVTKARCKYSECCDSLLSDILLGLVRTHVVLGQPHASHRVSLPHMVESARSWLLVMSIQDEALLFWRSHFCGRYATATSTTV